MLNIHNITCIFVMHVIILIYVLYTSGHMVRIKKVRFTATTKECIPT